MLARCARCQGTFTTDRYGRQTCPHCGSELILPPPPGTPPEAEAPPPAEPGPAGLPPPPTSGAPGPGGGSELPPPPPPPPGGYGPPPSGWGPQGGGFGAPPGGYPPPPGGGWCPSGRPPPGAEAPSPFADRARLGFFHAFFETWKLVATQPEAFFARVRVDQTGTALLFAVIASLVGNTAAAFYGWLSGQQAAGTMQGMLSGMPEDQARLMRTWLEAYASGKWALAQVVLTPILVVVLSYLGAAILHLFLRLFRGAHRGFDATLTVVAYVQGLNLLGVVPGCGSFLALVWVLVAAVIGLAAAQRCGVGRAVAAIAPLVVLACCCGTLTTGMIMAGSRIHQQDARPGQTTTL